MILIILNTICWILTFICFYILLNPKVSVLKNIKFSPFKERIFKKRNNVSNLYELLDLSKLKKLNNNFDVMVLNFNGSLNVGNIMRIACIYGVNTFHILGRKIYDSRSCVGSNKYINIKINKDIINELPDKSVLPKINYLKFKQYLLDNNLCPIFIEQGGTSILDFHFNELLNHDNIPVLIFGNETNGIPKKLIEICKNINGFKVLSIPQFGALKSLNVSNSASIVLWELHKSYEKRKVI